MNLEEFEKRVKVLEESSQQFMAQYNASIGRLAEARELLEMLKSGACKVEAVATAVADVVQAVEHVAETVS